MIFFFKILPQTPYGARCQPLLIRQSFLGSKEHNIPNLMPFSINELNIASPNMAITLRDVKLYGFNNSELTSYKFNFDTLHLNTSVYNKHLIVDSECEMNGRIPPLNIHGNGHLKMKLRMIFNLFTKKLTLFSAKLVLITNCLDCNICTIFLRINDIQKVFISLILYSSKFDFRL